MITEKCEGKWGEKAEKKGKRRKLSSEGLIKITNNSIVNEKYMRQLENCLVKLRDITA